MVAIVLIDEENNSHFYKEIPMKIKKQVNIQLQNLPLEQLNEKELSSIQGGQNGIDAEVFNATKQVIKFNSRYTQIKPEGV